MSANIEVKELKEIKCPKMGTIDVFVQGQRFAKETVILNVHDLGNNHSHYIELLNDVSMKKIAQKTVWVFVILPGHLADAPNLPAGYEYPTMQEISDDLVTVLDELKIKEVVLFGEGAGANILLRFAVSHPSRVLGGYFMNTTATSNNFIESIQDKIRSRKMSVEEKTSADDFLVQHRFGTSPSAILKYHHSNATRLAVERYQEFVHKHMNLRNVKLYVESYNKRSNITQLTQLRCPAVFVTSERSSFRQSTRLIHQNLLKATSAEKNKIEFVDVSDVGNVLEESPEKVVESIQYFLQGLGIVSSVPMQNLNVVKQPRIRSMSMQDYDVPQRMRQRNISVTDQPFRGNTSQASSIPMNRRSGAVTVQFSPIKNSDDEPLIPNSPLHQVSLIVEEPEEKTKD